MDQDQTIWVTVANDNERHELTRLRERLRFRSWHRGTKEMDLLLGNFANSFVHDFDEPELKQFDNLLHESDPDLYDWYLGKEKVPVEKNSHVMKQFLEYKMTAQS